MKREELESVVNCRRRAWQDIERIKRTPGIGDLEALRRCLNVADVYAAMTGDDSLHPPRVREEHDKMTESIPNIMKVAEKRRKDKANGVIELF